MKTQKIVNLLNGSDNESSKLATKKWYIINDQNNAQYVTGDENGTNIKSETKVIKSNLCDYSDACVFVTGNITTTGGNLQHEIYNCAPFTTCVAHINVEHVETAENMDIIMPIYNVLEYSNNYADSSGLLWKFKRDEQDITGIPNAVTTNSSTSFKYKSNLLGAPNAIGALKDAKIVVPLKYLCNFFRSLEMPLIYCKIDLKLNWAKNCIMS